MNRILLLAFFLISAACSSAGKHAAVLLSYRDFGPQVIAHEVIGMEWWQWQNHGDSRPTNYDIKVVVYRGFSLTQIEREYSVSSEEKKDFRYLEYAKAIIYLDEKIEENVIDEMTKTLKKTREKLQLEFR